MPVSVSVKNLVNVMFQVRQNSTSYCQFLKAGNARYRGNRHSRLSNRKWLTRYWSRGEAAKAHLLTAARACLLVAYLIKLAVVPAGRVPLDGRHAEKNF